MDAGVGRSSKHEEGRDRRGGEKTTGVFFTRVEKTGASLSSVCGMEIRIEDKPVEI